MFVEASRGITLLRSFAAPPAGRIFFPTRALPASCGTRCARGIQADCRHDNKMPHGPTYDASFIIDLQLLSFMHDIAVAATAALLYT